MSGINHIVLSILRTVLPARKTKGTMYFKLKLA